MKKMIVIATVVMGLLVGGVSGTVMAAGDPICNDPAFKNSGPCVDNRDVEGFASNIINTVIYVLGFVAVGMIVYGGVQYTMSTGNPEKVKSAKNTILYAIVGLVIAVLAFAIVNFVITGLL